MGLIDFLLLYIISSLLDKFEQLRAAALINNFFLYACSREILDLENGCFGIGFVSFEI